MTMTGVSRLFIDTNIIIYAADGTSLYNQLAKQALLAARQQASELVISSQILREYLSTTTKSYLITGVPSLSNILFNYNAFQNDFTVVFDSLRVVMNLSSLLQTIPMGGKQIYDANIVATIQAYSITHLLTHNVKDFARFAGLITVVPLQASNP